MKRIFLVFALLFFSEGCFPELNRNLLDISIYMSFLQLLKKNNIPEAVSPPIDGEDQTNPADDEVIISLTPPSILIKRQTGETLSSNEIIHFGKVGVGNSGLGKTIQIEVSNQGESDLVIQSLSITGGSNFTIINSGLGTILNGQSTIIELRYLPSVATIHSSILEIVSNSILNGTINITLSGEGETIDSGLTVYYRFSGDLNDSSGNGNNGNQFGTLTYGQDRNGNPNSAIVGDGTGTNRFSVNLSPAWAWDSTYSATAWVNASGWFNLLGRRFITTCTTMIVLLVADTKVALGRDSFSCGGWAVFDSVIQSETLLDRWVHVAYVVSSGNGTFYINGVASGTFSIPGSPTFGSDEIQFLADNFFGPLNGRLDEVRIYNTTALTASQVQAIYNQD
jgi:hypothetical protein